MTVKKGDIVFVSQPHTPQVVAAVVMDTAPAKLSGLPQAVVHIISSTDPYSWTIVPHREYADDSGYLEADESEPTALRPKETTNADAPQEHSEGESETPDAEGLGARMDDSESDSSETEDETDEDESEEDSSEDEGPFDVESDEESDEREEDQGSEEVPPSEQDGEPVSATKRKRGGRSKR